MTVCRLLGMIATKPVDLRFCLVEGPYTLADMSHSNPDGWGLGWYEKGRPVLVKEPRQAAESPVYENTAASARSRIFVAHVREGTVGQPTEQNCHPFNQGQWLFAHNGSVDREGLRELLNEKGRTKIKGETDSEVYFHWILQNIEQEGSVQKGIQVALQSVRRYSHTGLNFVLSDGKSLFAYRGASEDHDYYSFYWLLRDPRCAGPATFRSREVKALVESKSLNKEKAVLVCSEKLTEEDWQEVPLDHLLVVSGDLNLRLVEME